MSFYAWNLTGTPKQTDNQLIRRHRKARWWILGVCAFAIAFRVLQFYGPAN